MQMKLLIVSGLSGSGKSIVLKALEDCGYYCMDDLAGGDLESFANVHLSLKNNLKIAISINSDFKQHNNVNYKNILATIRKLGIDYEVIYLQAEDSILLQRNNTHQNHASASYLINNLFLEKKNTSPSPCIC